MKALRITLIILAIILVPLIVFFGVDFYHYSKDKSPYRTLFIPRLEVSLFEVTDLSADRTDMLGKMLIHSPLPFNLAADSLQYKIYISDVEVIKSTYTKSLNIKKWDSTWIELPVTIYQDKLLTTLDNADKEGKDSMVYRIQTTFYTHIPFKKTFTIDIETLQPLFYIPTARLEKVDYDSLSGKGVTLYIKLMIGNRNKMDFQFKDLKYKFSLANSPWVYGAKWGVIDIKKQDSTELILPVRVSFTDVFKSIGPLIRKGGKTDYKVGLDLKLVSSSNSLKNSKVIVKDEGTVHEIVKLAKDEKKKGDEKKNGAEKKNGKEKKKEKQKEKKKEREEKKAERHKSE